MVRPYLNKSDHEEYLRQFKAERNKRIKHRLLIAALGSMALIGTYLSFFGGSNSIPESFPAYLGGETAKQETIENTEAAEISGAIVEEDVNSQQKEIIPEILDSNKLPVEAIIEDDGKPATQSERESNLLNEIELEADGSQSPPKEISESLHEVARGPITEKVSDRSGMKKNPELSPASILFSAEKMPKFPGGYSALKKYIKKSLQIPEAAINEKIEGTVQVQFIVDLNGSIQSPRIAKGLGHGCDEAALALVKGMPNWIPGKHNGEDVAVYYNLPVKFSGK